MSAANIAFHGLLLLALVLLIVSAVDARRAQRRRDFNAHVDTAIRHTTPESEPLVSEGPVWTFGGDR